MPGAPDDTPISVEAEAAIDLLAKTGMQEFELRFSEGEGKDPLTVWMALAKYPGSWEVAAARKPSKAIMRLVELVVDGAICTHCGKMCGLDTDFSDPTGMNTATAPLVCWYIYDPELRKFRRSCEGE